MNTPGELLDRKLKGEDISYEDIKNSTENYFKKQGINCKCSVVKKEETKDSV